MTLYIRKFPYCLLVKNAFIGPTLTKVLVGQNVLKLDTVNVVCETIVLLQVGPANYICEMYIISLER